MSCILTYQDLEHRMNELERTLVAQQKELERLRQNDTRLQLLQQSLPMVLYIAEPFDDYGGTWVSDQVEKISGFSAVQFMAEKGLWADRLHPEDKEKALTVYGDIHKSEYIELEYRWQVADGSYRWLRDTATLVRDKLDKPEKVIGTWLDITEQKLLAEESEKNRKRFDDLADTLPQIIFETDEKGQLTYVNSQAYNLTSYTEEDLATGVNVLGFVVPEDRERAAHNMQRVMNGEKLPAGNEYTIVKRDGSTLPVMIYSSQRVESGAHVGFQGIIVDISERKKMEDELRKAHKLESIGILAGGIAHDFNNILTAVIGNISLARIYSKPGEKIYKKLEEAERATLRAKDLTQQLLTFSKGGEPIKRSVDLPKLLRETSNFVLRGSNVKCMCNPADELWAVEVDEGQLSQVIHNLVINGDQAMPEGGEITITARNRDVSPEDNLSLQEGSYVEVAIVDQGTGIKEEHLNRIFDPYFSTKQKGHGLGLATAYSVMKNHDGLLTVNSTLGRGSTFTIYIPATRKSTVKDTVEREVLHQGSGRVLLMDDEEDVRYVASEMLAHIGYEVTPAADGQEAMELYKIAMQAGKTYDVVIMDLTIPGGIGGRETIKKLQTIDPMVKAIVSSGYANDPIMANYKEYGFIGVVPKPYKIEQLSDVLGKAVR